VAAVRAFWAACCCSVGRCGGSLAGYRGRQLPPRQKRKPPDAAPWARTASGVNGQGPRSLAPCGGPRYAWPQSQIPTTALWPDDQGPSKNLPRRTMAVDKLR